MCYWQKYPQEIEGNENTSNIIDFSIPKDQHSYIIVMQLLNIKHCLL